MGPPSGKAGPEENVLVDVRDQPTHVPRGIELDLALMKGLLVAEQEGLAIDAQSLVIETPYRAIVGRARFATQCRG